MGTSCLWLIFLIYNKNAQDSSRSHSIFTVYVEGMNESGSIRTGKLNLVDLAGSERQSKTGGVIFLLSSTFLFRFLFLPLPQCFLSHVRECPCEVIVLFKELLVTGWRKPPRSTSHSPPLVMSSQLLLMANRSTFLIVTRNSRGYCRLALASIYLWFWCLGLGLYPWLLPLKGKT